jgi:fucose permease
MKPNKKGQGLSMNTIVIAALVIVVLLVVLAVIYGTTDKVIPFLDSQTECSASDGKCIDSEQCGGIKIHGLCEKEGEVCCKTTET